MICATANAKVIIAGEHAVLRGSKALILPINKLKIAGSFVEGDKTTFVCSGKFNFADSNVLWKNLIETAQNLSNKTLPRGTWSLEINMPIAAGLGFSSAVSVIIAKILNQIGLVSKENIFNFSHQIEAPMHSKSSGCDIAGAMSNLPLEYESFGQYKSIKNNWLPNFSWTLSGDVSQTKKAVKYVENLDVLHIDKKMTVAANLAIEAWKNKDLISLAESMDIASQCFFDWGLVTVNMQKKIELMKSMGALAVKPTGAGNGGAIIALWDKQINIKEVEWIH